MWRIYVRVFIAALLLGMVSPASAQEYPNKPIRLIVPVASGAMTDMVARLFSQKLAERLGEPVVVENKAGAGGNIGTAYGARAKPDGYTLILSWTGPLVVNPLLYKNLGYDPAHDFVPVSLLVSFPEVLAVAPSVPAKNVAELIALAKHRSRPFSYGSAGNGTTSHLSMELFCREAGIKMLHVPYKGAAAAMNDLIGGRIDMVFDTLTMVMPQNQAGRVRAIAVTSKERSSEFPDIPSIAETIPGFDVSGWIGIIAPVGTPQPIVDRLSLAFSQIAKEPDVKKVLSSSGMELRGLDAPSFGRLINSERSMWEKVITENQIKIE